MRHKALIAAGVAAVLVGGVASQTNREAEYGVPGSVDPRVTQATIHRTVCVSGYTRTVRPPVSYTNNLKRKQILKFHLNGPPSAYEEDHLVPLATGGHPTDPDNLWPEKWSQARRKDSEEREHQHRVCSGEETLRQAQRFFKEKYGVAR